MLKAIIHAGGESTRLKEIFLGPKALAPVCEHTLLWYHLQPMLKSNTISEYVFTLRHQHEVVQAYIDNLRTKFGMATASVVEPCPVGRAGAVKIGIDSGIIDLDSTYVMSNPDDFVPIDFKELERFSKKAEDAGKAMVVVMARNAVSPFGIGITERNGDVLELKNFIEKPELPFIENHFANTGTMVFMPEAMEKFRHLSLDKLTNPEYDIVPALARDRKVAVFLVDRWISVNYSSDYKSLLKMGSETLEKFLGI